MWEATGHELAASLRALGLPVGTVVTMEADKEGPRRALKAIREADRVRGEFFFWVMFEIKFKNVHLKCSASNSYLKFLELQLNTKRITEQ